MKKLYVGNLSYDTSEEALKEFFTEYGPVASVKIITDSYSGQSKGFGFVELDDDQLALDAIANLNGQSLNDRQIRVDEARPQQGGGRGGRGGGYRGGGGGNRHSGGGRGGYGNRGGGRY